MSQKDLQRYVKDLLEKHASETCTPQEEQFLQDWYNNIGHHDDTQWDQASKDSVRQRLWSSINPQENKSNRSSWRYRIAAIIVLPILAGVAFYAMRNAESVPEVSARKAVANTSRIYNDGEEERRITLVDGSVVVLQPTSEILLASVFNNEVREVYLEGEAFFDITHDPQRPFIVYASEVVTRVLGTSFSIKAYERDQEVTVSVKTGRVSVYKNLENTSKDPTQHPEEVILTPNQKMIYDRHTAVVSKQLVEEPEIVLPQSNLLAMSFDNAEVSEIFGALAENYGVEIHFDERQLGNCRLTTSMSNEGLYERIEVICKAIGASYYIKDAVIVIASNGC